MRAFLEHVGIDNDDFVFFDGSGLSGHDLVTPRATARLLQYASTQSWFSDWKTSLPVGGEDGSLAVAVWEASAEGPCICEDGNPGRGSGVERIFGVCERKDGNLFDHGGESSARDK